MFISKHIYFVILIVNVYKCACKLSDQRLCVDDACSVPISRARTLLRYSSPEPNILSFSPNQEVVIFSKEAGSVANLWGAEINGKRGYIPKNLVREYKVLNKHIKLVEGEKNNEPQVPKSSKDDVKPDKPLKTYEIVDGTKLYLDSPEQIHFEDNESSSEKLTKTSEQIISSDQNIENKTPKENDTTDPSSFQTNENLPFSLNINAADLSDLIQQNETPIDEVQAVYHNIEEPSSNENQTVIDKEEIIEEISINEGETTEKASFQKETKGNPAANEQHEEETAEEPSVQKEIKENPSANEQHEEQITVDVNSDLMDEKKNPENYSTEEKLVNEVIIKNEPAVNEKMDKKLADNDKSDKTDQEIEVNESNSLHTKLNNGETSSEDVKLENLNPVGTIPSTLENSVFINNDVAKKELNTFESRQLKSVEEQDVPNKDSETLANSSSETLSKTLQNEEVAEEIKDTVEEITNNLQKNIESSNEVESSGVNEPYTTMLPIFSPLSGNFLNSVSPPVASKEIEKEGVLEHFVSPNEKPKYIQPEQSSNDNTYDSENESKESESDGELESSQEDKKIEIIPPNEPIPSPTTVEDINISNDYIENDVEASIEIEDKYLSEPSSDSGSEIPTNHEEVASDQTVFADDTITENPIISSNEMPVENSNNENNPGGIFSVFTSMFDWSTSKEENDNSAIDNINTNDLKCDPSEGIVSYDFYSFNLNSNMMMHFVTTIVIFITFLLFYLSVNKYRIESPLVAKINQLEKDLLISIKEKETLAVKGVSDLQTNSSNSEKMCELNQNLQKVYSEKEDLEIELNKLREELEKKDVQIENLEKELETSTEVGLELNRLMSEMLDPSSNGSEKLKENVEQFQRQLHEQTEVIKNITARLNAKEVENVELLLELEETKKIASSEQQRTQELIEKITHIEREKEAQQNSLQNEIRVYQASYNELGARNEILNNEIQILKTKLVNSEREIDLKIKECNSLKESFKNISSMKNDNKKLNSVLDGISLKAEYEQLKTDIEKYTRELQQNQSEKSILENKYQNLVQEVSELQRKYIETDKEKTETELKLDVLNNYFKKREAELQEEVLKYKSIWDAKEGEATSTTERIKLLQEEIENYKTQNETLKQEILSQEIALKSQISALEKKAHESWVHARQAERKLEDARQEAAQLRNKLTFRQRNINEEVVPNGLEQNDSTQPLYSPASPPLFFDNGRDQVTKSPIPGLPPFLPPPPGAPFVPPPVPNLPGMHMPPPFMPLLPPGFPGDHRPPPLGRMSSPPIKSRFSPESAFSPYERGSPSPIYDSEYGGGPYRNYSPYNSEDDRRGYRSPSPISRTKPRASKNSLASQNINRSHESLEKTNSKKSNSMV